MWRYISIICFLSGQGLGNTEFRVSSFPFPFYFTNGRDISLSCLLPNDAIFNKWTGPSNDTISNSGRYVVELRGFIINLRIKNSNQSDGGTYTCHISVNGVTQSKSIETYFVDLIEVHSPNKNVTVYVGDFYSFFCNASNVIYRQWQFSTNSSRPVGLRNTSDRKIAITPKFELHLRNITLADEGIYQCYLASHLEVQYITNYLFVQASRPTSSSTNVPHNYISGSLTDSTYELKASTLSILHELPYETTLTLSFKTTDKSRQGQDLETIPNYIYIIMAAGGMMSFIIISVISLVFGFHVCNSRKNTENYQQKNVASILDNNVNTKLPTSTIEDPTCVTDDVKNNLLSVLPKCLLIPPSSIFLKEIIGKGEFGTVYSADLIMKGHSQNVAVKKLNGNISSTSTTLKNVLQEIIKMECLSHPNVMPLTGVCMEDLSSISIVMPLMKTSLLDYLRDNRENLKPKQKDHKVDDVQKELLQICVEIARGMEYLTKIMFVHRDLAARNCMLDFNHQVKISDFGLTEDVYTYVYFQQNANHDIKLPLKWMALESLQQGKFTEKTDVWSFGVTCWETFSGGDIPYPGIQPSAIAGYLESGQRLQKPLNKACTDGMYKLMNSCWHQDSAKRPNFSELVAMLDNQLKAVAKYLEIVN